MKKQKRKNFLYIEEKIYICYKIEHVDKKIL